MGPQKYCGAQGNTPKLFYSYRGTQGLKSLKVLGSLEEENGPGHKAGAALPHKSLQRGAPFLPHSL